MRSGEPLYERQIALEALQRAAIAGSSGPNVNPSTNPALLQPTWFIDPQNVTGKASDSNSGIDAAHPLLHWSTITQRWNTIFPLLGQATTVTFLSSHIDNSDPVVLYPTTAAQLTFQGTITRLATGSLGAVTAKNRASGQLLNANLGRVPIVATVIHNTTAGKDSYAWVHANLGGNVAELTQPLSRTAVTGYTTPNTEVDTWALNDTFEVLSFPSINLVTMDARTWAFPVGPTTGVLFKNLTLFDPNGIFVDDCYLGPYVALTECAVQRSIIYPYMKADLLAFMQNCFFQGGGSPFPPMVTFGGSIQNVMDTSFATTLDGDMIIDLPGQFPTCHDNTLLALVALTNATTLNVVQMVVAKPQNYAVANCVWGQGGVNLAERATFGYTAPATGAGGSLIFTGPLTINTRTTAAVVDSSVDPAVIHPGRTLTTAHLDATVAGGGFAGTAVDLLTFGTVTSGAIS